MSDPELYRSAITDCIRTASGNVEADEQITGGTFAISRRMLHALLEEMRLSGCIRSTKAQCLEMARVITVFQWCDVPFVVVSGRGKFCGAILHKRPVKGS